MEILAKVGAALQQLLGPLAEAAAAATGVIRRQRVFTPLSLARTFVLGFLRHPNASDEQLAQLAAACGAPVTPQAIDQRHTPVLARFLEDLFRRATQVALGASRALAPLLERFPSVTLLDATTVVLPDGQRGRFAGCGNTYGAARAALKLQTELDLRSGALTAVEITPGRQDDHACARQHARRAPGSLRITDLGYFCVAVFAALVQGGAHFLSRLKTSALVYEPDGARLDLRRWLAAQPPGLIDRPVLLAAERLPCRLLAWRVPQEQADRRRHKLRKANRRRGRGTPEEALAWCAWTVLITSVRPEQLSGREALLLYRARWQVELLFKRWKSQGLVAQLSGATEARQLVRVWARLLAVLAQHWLVVAGGWGDPARSLSKACEAVREFVGQLASSLDDEPALQRVLATLCQTLAKTCRQNKRAKPGTAELLNDVGLLDFNLT
jgi:hypothetical protein